MRRFLPFALGIAVGVTAWAIHRASAADPYTWTGSAILTPPSCPGTLPTCAANLPEGGSCIVNAGGGATTKECRCIRNAGTYQWASTLLTTNAVTTAGGTTTSCP